MLTSIQYKSIVGYLIIVKAGVIAHATDVSQLHKTIVVRASDWLATQQSENM